MLKKIISGGQTGADRAGLDFAIKNNISHGGWIPKGRKTEDGPLPERYQLQEMPTVRYIGVSRDPTQPYAIFGGLDQAGTLSGSCKSRQNGRGGTFYVLTNKTLFDGVTELIKGETAAVASKRISTWERQKGGSR
jgi:hypothetical protein